jgi:malonate transporter and related proteins
MLNSSITVLLPIFFVLSLGYFAGRTKQFNSEQASGLNELVLDYALPASLFVGASSTPRDQLLQQAPLFLAIFITLMGLYLIAWLVSRTWFHYSIGTAALQACIIASPTAPFIGTPVLSGLFGASSAVSIAISAIVINVVQVPLTLMLIQIELSQKSGEHSSLKQMLKSSVLNLGKIPVVWAAILAILFVILGVQVPSVVDNMLNLIGTVNSGVAVFFSGVTLAAYSLKLNREVVLNSVLKMVVQPLIMAGLVFAFSIPNPAAIEGIILCGLPTGVIGVILASRYRLYTSAASSSLLLTSMLMIVTLPITLALIRH